MLNNLEKTPLRPYWYLSVLFIALGVYGSLSGVLPLTWIWFIVGGALAIVTQFNFETLRVSMGKMEKGSWKIIFLVNYLNLYYFICHYGIRKFTFPYWFC